MIVSKPSLKLSLAFAAFTAAIFVYLFVRAFPPEMLAPMQMATVSSPQNSSWAGSAPSFFYTLAVCLLISTLASSNSHARKHCLIWLILVIVLEVSQHSYIAQLLVIHLPESIPGSVWRLIGPYWIHGVFDFVDVLASMAGGLVCLALFHQSPKDQGSEADS